MMGDIPDDLDELALAIRDRRVILFAGAGVSMVVGLPSWQTLIRHMQDELGVETAQGDQIMAYQTLAEYYRITRSSIGPLRSWMDRTWSVSPAAIRESRIHEIIVALDFPIIYTTNYDRNLEIAFEIADKPYVKIANARDMALADLRQTQIVKFHGDFDDDESLVLTETDYFSRLSFDSPLDVKFRADAMGQTVLFIGYSMQDLNIRLLLHRIWETWEQSGYEREWPKSYVFMPALDPVQEAVLDRWGITLVTHPAENPAEALQGFLERLRERVDQVEAKGRQGDEEGSGD